MEFRITLWGPEKIVQGLVTWFVSSNIVGSFTDLGYSLLA